MTQKDLADRIGLEQPSIFAIEKSKAKSHKLLAEIAEALGQTQEWLKAERGDMRLYKSAPGKGRTAEPARTASAEIIKLPRRLSLAPDVTVAMRNVPVIGYVQAGVWLATIELPPEDRYDIPLPIQSGFDRFDVFGLVVRGPSMDEVYPHGSVLAVVKFLDLGREPRHGERVVALRLRHGETEATVKEFRVDRDGKARLWPRSTHPSFQEPVPLDERDGEDAELHVAYLVIGSYRPEM